MVKSHRPDAWPEDAENWSIEEISDYVEKMRDHPDSLASERFRETLNALAQDKAIQKSPVYARLVLILQDCIADYTPEWNLDDILEPLIIAIKSHSGKSARKRTADESEKLKEMIQALWVSDKGQLSRAEFAYKMVKEIDVPEGKIRVTEGTIRKHYLSKNAIAAYKKKISGDA